jgi:hypothetical protein
LDLIFLLAQVNPHFNLLGCFHQSISLLILRLLHLLEVTLLPLLLNALLHVPHLPLLNFTHLHLLYAIPLYYIALLLTALHIILQQDIHILRLNPLDTVLKGSLDELRYLPTDALLIGRDHFPLSKPHPDLMD